MLRCKCLFFLILLNFHISKSAEWAKIIGLTTGATVIYESLSHQLIVRMSPKVFDIHGDDAQKEFIKDNINNPTKIGLFFGITNALPLGLVLGGMIATSCRIGSWQKLSFQDLLKTIPTAFLLLGFCLFKEEIKRSTQGKSYINNSEISEGDRIQEGRKIIKYDYAYGSFIGLGLCGYTLYQRITAEK